MITFDAPQEKSLLKTVEKGKNHSNPFKKKLHHFSHNELSLQILAVWAWPKSCCMVKG